MRDTLGSVSAINHCQSFGKCLLDHTCRKAQVVHHSLPSMNAVPPAPVSSSSWRHGLLAAKIAKHEHLQSIQDPRICPLSPEQGAPSFSRKPMMSIDVGVRVRQGKLFGVEADVCGRKYLYHTCGGTSSAARHSIGLAT